MNGHSYAKSNPTATVNNLETSKKKLKKSDSPATSSSEEESSGDTYKPNGKVSWKIFLSLKTFLLITWYKTFLI